MKALAYLIILSILAVTVTGVVVGTRLALRRYARWEVETVTDGGVDGGFVIVRIARRYQRPIEIGRVNVRDPEFAERLYELQVKASEDIGIPLNLARGN